MEGGTEEGLKSQLEAVATRVTQDDVCCSVASWALVLSVFTHACSLNLLFALYCHGHRVPPPSFKCFL